MKVLDEIRALAAEAARLAEPPRVPAGPPTPGDVYILPDGGELPIEWVLARRFGAPLGVLVPADGERWRVGTDVPVHALDGRRLRARLGWAVLADLDRLTLRRRVDRLPPSMLGPLAGSVDHLPDRPGAAITRGSTAGEDRGHWLRSLARASRLVRARYSPAGIPARLDEFRPAPPELGELVRQGWQPAGLSTPTDSVAFWAARPGVWLAYTRPRLAVIWDRRLPVRPHAEWVAGADPVPAAPLGDRYYETTVPIPLERHRADLRLSERTGDRVFVFE